MAEQYEDDARPISAFAASQGASFYDHDFLEVQFDPSFASVDDVLAGLSFSSSFADAVRAAVPAFDFNGAIALFSDEIAAPVSFENADVHLTYVGRFECDPNATSTGFKDTLDSIFIHLLGGVQVEFEGAMTDCVEVDGRGLMIGRANPYARSLDISSLVPEVADNQLRIAQYHEMWELRDFGNNGLSRLGKSSFDNERSLPWPGITFSVGPLEFLWSDSPTRD